MINQPDFIGIGAQKSGTSWVYACLCEHPDVCMPHKEIRFFSREENWSKGYNWYINKFSSCRKYQRVGEFSTSYLSDINAPQRIYTLFPNIKLIVSLRDPIDRAYSNYINDIKSGIVNHSTSFLAALKIHPEYMEQGMYANQLKNYMKYFSQNQILIMIYEDSIIDPKTFIENIYNFIDVDNSFISEYLQKKINIARIPRHLWVDKGIGMVASLLKSSGLNNIFWKIKKSGLPDKIRSINTLSHSSISEELDDNTRRILYEYYDCHSEINAISDIIGRNLNEWRI